MLDPFLRKTLTFHLLQHAWNPLLFQNNPHDELSQQSGVDRPLGPRNESDVQLPVSQSGRVIRPVDYYGY